MRGAAVWVCGCARCSGYLGMCFLLLGVGGVSLGCCVYVCLVRWLYKISNYDGWLVAGLGMGWVLFVGVGSWLEKLLFCICEVFRLIAGFFMVFLNI